MITDKRWSDSKFIGSYNLKLSTNSRIKIPDNFLDIYKHKQSKILKIIPWYYHSLALFPIEEWEGKKKCEGIPLKYIREDYYIKRFINISRSTEIDKGQIFIDKLLQSYAKIQKNIIMIGVFFRYAELWGKEVWDNYYKNQNIKEIMDSIDLLK